MLTEEEQKLVSENRGKDPARIALSVRPSATVRPSVVAQQVDAYNRLEEKVPTWAEKDGLLFPFPVAIQQCSSEPLARFRESLTFGCDSLIDLTGGLGIDCYFMGLEKSRVTYVDKSPEAVEAAKHNYEILGVKNTTFVNSSAEDYVKKCIDEGITADVVFVDPSRRSQTGERVFMLNECSPDVSELCPQLLKIGEKVIIKLSPLLDISLTVSQLSNVADVYVIGRSSECKDLMVCLKAKIDEYEERLVHAVTIDKEGNMMSDIAFSPKEEKELKADLLQRLPYPGERLYVPQAAIMKAGPFATLGQMMELKMLGNGTHIYASQFDIPSFPGRSFVVEGIYDLSKQSLKKLREVTTSASIAVRNYPLTAEALRKKLKFGESSTYFLFGVTAYGGQQVLILCTKTT